MDSTAYLDLRNGEREPLFFFMLNAYLQSRIETDHESDGDEEVNVYLAGLLLSLVDGRFYADNVDRLATSALDVCQKAEESGTDRGKTNVYRTNADHRLMAFGLFSGFGDHVSLYRRGTTPDEAYIDEARQFYSWAGAFCSRQAAVPRPDDDAGEARRWLRRLPRGPRSHGGSPYGPYGAPVAGSDLAPGI